MRKLYSVVSALILTFSTFSCAEKNISLQPIENQVDISAKKGDINILIKLDTTPFISTSSGELSGVALSDDGRIYKYQTTKNGTSFQATTFVYQSKWNLIESHTTNANEAETILRLAGQGGFAKEYKTLKDRYTQIGLVDSRK